MAVAKGRAVQTATMYRKLDSETSDDDSTYLNDERFDAITEKVIAYMDRTDPEEWTSNQWGLFRTLWTDRKMKRRLTEQEATKQLTTEQLKHLMNSDDP